MKKRLANLLIIIVCLVIGAIIYASTRSDSIILNKLLANLDGGKIFGFFQSLDLYDQLPHWFIYSLPDGLWMAALILLVLLIWDFKLHKKSIPWIAIAFGFGILFEVFQGFNIVRGTFDVIDLLFILTAAIIPITITYLNHAYAK